MKSLSTSVFRLLCLFIFLPALRPAYAGVEGVYNLNLNYAQIQSDTLYEYGGEKEIEDVDTKVQLITLMAGYDVSDALNVTVALPYSMTSYDGKEVYAHGPKDGGETYGTFTDLSLTLSYLAFQSEYLGVAVLTKPIIPVTDYEVRGFAGAGQNLKQWGNGFSLGTNILDAASFNLTYMYYWVERLKKGDGTDEYHIDRSELSSSIEGMAADWLGLRLGIFRLVTHGGFDFSNWSEANSDVREWHDPIRKVIYTNYNLGATYFIQENMGITIDYTDFISGNNTTNAKVIAFGTFFSDFL